MIQQNGHKSNRNIIWIICNELMSMVYVLCAEYRYIVRCAKMLHLHTETMRKSRFIRFTFWFSTFGHITFSFDWKINCILRRIQRRRRHRHCWIRCLIQMHIYVSHNRCLMCNIYFRWMLFMFNCSCGNGNYIEAAQSINSRKKSKEKLKRITQNTCDFMSAYVQFSIPIAPSKML